MKTSKTFVFSATNPCHVWDQARGLAALGEDVVFYSGYPHSRLLGDDHGTQVVPVSGATLLSYAVTRLTGRSNLLARILYKWQDITFDKSVSIKQDKHLRDSNKVLVGLPGQSLRTFKSHQHSKSVRVLNHASGPVETQSEQIDQEIRRLNIPFLNSHPEIHDRRRIFAERELSDLHLVASSIVKKQLISAGLDSKLIHIAPYGVDDSLFRKKVATHKLKTTDAFKAIFAGQSDIRKGVHWLLETWSSLQPKDQYTLEICGPITPWLKKHFTRIKNSQNIRLTGTVSQAELATKIRNSDALILPSVEDAFGLVVPQSLQCGTPVIVSDRVGAKDLIIEGKNGYIVPFGDSGMLTQAIKSLRSTRLRVTESFTYVSASQILRDCLYNVAD